MSSPSNTRPGHSGGAIWCDDHQRWECVKHRKAARGGGRCHARAVVGLNRCRAHLGVKPELGRAQGEAMDAWSTAGQLDLTPAEAVVAMYKLAFTRAHFYGGLLEEQVLQAHSDDPDAESFGESTRGAAPVGEGAGLIGHQFSADKEWGIYPTGEAIRGLVQLEAQERDRVVRFAKAAHDMGIADREIRLAEQQGALIAAAVKRILAGLNLSIEQQEIVPQLVPSVLRAIASGEDAA